MKNKLLIGLASGGLALLFSFPTYAQSGCVKQVFNKYCLGGSIQSVLSTQAPTRTAEKGTSTNYVFSDGADRTNVVVVKGRIATVRRQYYPGTQQTFDSLYGQLSGLYGQPKRTIGSSNTAGRTTDMWDQGAWRVQLLWNEKREIHLIYQHENLQAAKRKAEATGRAITSNPQGF